MLTFLLLHFTARSALVLLVAFSTVSVRGLLLRDRVRSDDARHGGIESCSRLTNQHTHYTVEVGVGTPPQKFDLVADTGSNALVVQSCQCQTNTVESLCNPTEKCFVEDGNTSSTYIAPKANANLMMMQYGIGDIIVKAATDVVHVGRVSATMKMGLLLMVKRMFMTAYDFEGILGIGLPPWAEDPKKLAEAPTLHDDNLKPGARVRPPDFLDIAKINVFSMCFRPGMGGALRFNPPAMSRMLKQIGRVHWSLSLTGFSAGSTSAPISVCNHDDPGAGTESPCAAIPDSGTTHIMGPKKDVERILADLCTQWPRCAKFKANDPTVSSTMAFRKVLWACHTWMTPEEGVGEVPSLFVHLEGSDGETEVLEITATSYVYETTSVLGHPVCAPSLDVWKYGSKKHGPAWILGTPLFYEYQVGYGLRPPSIGFSKVHCDLCDDDTTSLMVSSNLSHAVGFLRKMSGNPRLPSIDVNDEL